MSHSRIVSHFFSTFILSFDCLLTGLIIPLACSKTLKMSIVCTESNRDSWVWYYQDSKMPCSPLLIQYARCAMLPSPPRLCPCVLSKALCPPAPPTPSPLFKFQLRGQILKKVLPDLPHSESEPISPCLCFKTRDNSIRAFVPICCFSN